MHEEPRLKCTECNAEYGLKLALKLDNGSHFRRVWEAAVPAALKVTVPYRPMRGIRKAGDIYLPQTNAPPGQRVYGVYEIGI
jgi:hypothetical protein